MGMDDSDGVYYLLGHCANSYLLAGSRACWSWCGMGRPLHNTMAVARAGWAL